MTTMAPPYHHTLSPGQMVEVLAFTLEFNLTCNVTSSGHEVPLGDRCALCPKVTRGEHIQCFEKSSYDALAGIHDVDAEEAAAKWTPLTCQAVVRNTLFSNQDTPSVTQSPLVF